MLQPKLFILMDAALDDAAADAAAVVPTAIIAADTNA